MIFTAVILFTSIAAFNVAVLFAVKRYIFSVRGDKASRFAELSDFVIERTAQSTAQSLKAVFMGVQSGEAKREKSLETALAKDLLTQKAPWLAAVLDSFPALKKQIERNPEMANQALAMIKRKSGPVNGQSSAQDKEYNSLLNPF